MNLESRKNSNIRGYWSFWLVKVIPKSSFKGWFFLNPVVNQQKHPNAWISNLYNYFYTTSDGLGTYLVTYFILKSSSIARVDTFVLRIVQICHQLKQSWSGILLCQQTFRILNGCIKWLGDKTTHPQYWKSNSKVLLERFDSVETCCSFKIKSFVKSLWCTDSAIYRKKYHLKLEAAPKMWETKM